MVALLRALAHDGFTTIPGFVDPFARDLLSPAWRFFHRRLARRLERVGPARRQRAVAQFDIVALRVSAVDVALRTAVAEGARQIVLLGAGFDTRAFRLPALIGVDAFEVDHPATQAAKRARSSQMRPLTKSLTFVPVDFERDALAATLTRAGLRVDEPVVWVWEGVVMYLTDQALRRTLDDIARCSRPGSVLIANYHLPQPSGFDPEQFFRWILLPLWGEPQVGKRTREAMAAEVTRVGFDVASDTGPGDWARSVGACEPAGRVANVMRLLVARRS
jgi:methyltransferase (TIGR00027 family)